MKAVTHGPDLAVVIPTWRGADRITTTLGALSDAAPGTEVIVVDDGSDDGTSDAARRAAGDLRVRVERHAANRGRAAACNTGLRAADAPWVVILDDDMTVRPGFLEAHRGALARAGSGACFLGRCVLSAPGADTPFAAFLRHDEGVRHRTLLAQRDDVPWRFCLTGNFSAPRDLLLRLGGYDERITLYGFEDIELGLRIHRAGVPIRYLPDAISLHRAYARDLDRLRERTYLSGRVAPSIAAAHPENPEVRAFLRLDGMGAPRPLADPPFLTAMKVLNLLVSRPGGSRFLFTGGGRPLLAAWIALIERIPARRVRHLTYHVARDVAYYRGIHDAAEESR